MRVTVIEALRRLFGRPADPPTRMTRDAALAAARAAAAAAGVADALDITALRRDGDRVVWVVGTATVGSGVTVEVDDATGAAGAVERWGVR